MKKISVCFLVHTEYHILIAMNQISAKYSGGDFRCKMLIKQSKRSSKLSETLDLSSFPIAYEFWESPSYQQKMDKFQAARIENLVKENFDEFIFFQEQDPLAVILTNKFSSMGCKIHLYQDGLKPYVSIRLHSPSLMLNHLKQWWWIKKNGYKGEPFFSFLFCKNYAFLSKINKVFLTFPQRYKNWNGKTLEKINLEMSLNLELILKKLFRWDESYLTDRNDVIFYMNQPMHDDGLFERDLINIIVKSFEDKKFYIKLHPLTNKDKLKIYRSIPNIFIIESSIPAELFISQLKNSMVVSVCSTSMFINNTSCKFFWLNLVAERYIKRLQRYRVINPTDHIITVKTMNELTF